MFLPSELNLPFTQFRPFQLEVASKVAGSRHYAFLLEAVTGFGKSLSAAAAQRLLNKRAVYLVATKQLQDQILSDLPYARTLKGRSNYNCLALEGYGCDMCLGECDYKHECPYLKAKSEALGAELAVLNYPYFLTEANFVKSFKDIPMLVADECDSLESELMNFIELSLSERQLRGFNLGTPRYKTKPESWLQWAKDALETLKPRVDTRSLLDMSIHEIRFQKELGALISKLEFFISWVDDTWVWERTDFGWAFKPVWVSRYAQAILWNKAQKVLAMSATILEPGQLSRNIGLKDYTYYQVPLSFPPENRPTYYLPTANLTNKLMDTELPKLVEGVKKVIDNYPNEHILVHCVSYKVRDALAQGLPNSSRILTHSLRDRAEVLTKFKTSKAPYVLLSPSMTRGIDLPYDQCRVIIMAKLPYPNLGSQQVSARLYGSSDGQSWYTHKTASTLVQATGRAQRAADDYCEVFILDKQFEVFYAKNKALFPYYWKQALSQNSPI